MLSTFLILCRALDVESRHVKRCVCASLKQGTAPIIKYRNCASRSNFEPLLVDFVQLPNATHYACSCFCFLTLIFALTERDSSADESCQAEQLSRDHQSNSLVCVDFQSARGCMENAVCFTSSTVTSLSREKNFAFFWLRKILTTNTHEYAYILFDQSFAQLLAYLFTMMFTSLFTQFFAGQVAHTIFVRKVPRRVFPAVHQPQCVSQSLPPSTA